MPGVVFLVVIPSAAYEREFLGINSGVQSNFVDAITNTGNTAATTSNTPGGGNSSVGGGGNNLNINLPDNNAVLRLEVELRDKNLYKNRRGGGAGPPLPGGRGKQRARGPARGGGRMDNVNVFVPLENILDELLVKLEIEHVTWSKGKNGNYYQVVFPLQAGEPCETTLHCLTELGIGTKFNSSVNVLPCSVSYDSLYAEVDKDEYSDDGEGLSKWNNFVETIKSKLTVKQVVDGVRAGGALSFDYLLLIVTADSLAALGLVENNAPNIVAAMLVSPLMGPVMSITFGTIISDRDLIKVGFISLALGIFISLLFGFIFGLILGTTEMPWGFNDWPTEEMKGRGNVRSLWMGVLWALTSGTGVAVALLQGSAGPLIGVAISASLLPPVVNCGLFWALACIWLIYPDIKMPHVKGEPYVGNSSYEFMYTSYLPTEFFVSGIVSGILTIVNIICIFITAIIVLKIKEVAAPYTSSPDLRRFWETDIRTVRKTNRSTIKHKKSLRGVSKYQDLNEPKNRELETVLEEAVREATNDKTFRKVKRMSYSSNAAGEITNRLRFNSGLRSGLDLGGSHVTPVASNTLRNSKLTADLQALDKLVSSLLLQQYDNNDELPERKSSVKFNRWRPLSRSLTGLITGSKNGRGIGSGGSIKSLNITSKGNISNVGNNFNNHRRDGNNDDGTQHTSFMPTILEQNQPSSPTATVTTRDGIGSENNRRSKSSWPERGTGVRGVLNTIANAPQRLSQSYSQQQDEENANLTQNILN